MNVVHTLLRYPPASGGVEEYTRELVERLRALGEDVSVETTNLKIHHPPALLDPVPNDPPYVHRHPARTYDVVGYPIPEGLKEELMDMPMDILHAHAFWYAPADIAARVAQRRNVRFVLNPYYHNTENRRTVKWQLYRILYGKSTVAAADAIVVISPHERDLLRADRFSMQRVELIPPGIDGTMFARRQPNPFPAWGLGDSKILLFAGRIAQSKGVDLLIRAVARVRKNLPKTHLAIIGEDFGFRASCEALAKELGVSAAITWAGKVTRAELLGAYQHAAVFVFPSRYEAFGIVALEASAAGCPVVATNDSAIPFVVRDGKTGLLFEKENVHDLARKIRAVLRNPAMAHTLGKQGSAFAKREFSWDRSAKKLHRLYTELMRTEKPLRREERSRPRDLDLEAGFPF